MPPPEPSPFLHPFGPSRPPATALRDDEIHAVVTRERAGLTRCWEAERAAPPNTVRLDVDVDVLASGTVGAVTLTGAATPTLRACIAARVGRWRFPRAAQPTSATFPVIFLGPS